MTDKNCSLISKKVIKKNLEQRSMHKQFAEIMNLEYIELLLFVCY